MIRAVLTGIGLWLAGSAVALACVCMAPETPEQKREIASRIASNASAVAEIELVEPLNHEAGRAELYRVVRLHVGQAPAEFRLDRQFDRTPSGEVLMTMTSCDVVPPPGERTLVVLYAGQVPGTYRIGGTCDHIFVNSPEAIDLIRAAAGAVDPAERG